MLLFHPSSLIILKDSVYSTRRSKFFCSFNYHTIIFLNSEKTLEAIITRTAEVKAFEFAAPVDGLKSMTLAHVWHLCLGTAEIEILGFLAGFVRDTIEVE